MTRAWHATPIGEIAGELGSDLTRGLTSQEAASRLEREGCNEIRKAEGDSALTILGRQFKNVVIWVLIGAVVVSVALGERLDGIGTDVVGGDLVFRGDCLYKIAILIGL